MSEDRYTNAHNRHFKELVSITLWKHSESDNKYRGCRYWSRAALQSYERHGAVVTSIRQYPKDALRHEHLVPRSQVTDLLFSLDNPTPASVRQIMDTLNIAVVVTVTEDARLSQLGDTTDPWRRYRDAGVEWLDTRADATHWSKHKRTPSPVNTKSSNSAIPDSAVLEVLVGHNPKKPGSKSYAIFQKMFDAYQRAKASGKSFTVGDARAVGYRNVDLQWDSSPDRQARTPTGAHIRIGDAR